MTFKELQAHYKTGYQFSKDTGMSATCYSMWKKEDCIPGLSQLRIERITNGKLKADWDGRS